MMLKNNFYKIFKKETLIFEYFSGIVTIDSVLKFKQNLIQDTKLTLGYLNYNFLIYFKDATFNIKPNEIIKYVEFSNKNFIQKEKRKVAFVTNSPNQVALVTLFKMESEYQNQKVEVFSNCENAFHWLGIPPLFIDEPNLIKKLQSN